MQMNRNAESRGLRAYGAITSGNDRRIALRYSLRAHVDFTWEDENGVAREGRGYSHNISAKGARLIAADCPSPGTAVTLNVYFPSPTDDGAVLRMKAVGRVLRVGDGNGGWSGFAIQSERMSVCTE